MTEGRNEVIERWEDEKMVGERTQQQKREDRQHHGEEPGNKDRMVRQMEEMDGECEAAMGK